MNEHEIEIFIKGIRLGLSQQEGVKPQAVMASGGIDLPTEPVLRKSAKHEQYYTKAGKIAWRPISGKSKKPKVITRKRWTVDEDLAILNNRTMGNIELERYIPGRRAKMISQRKAYLKTKGWAVQAKPEEDAYDLGDDLAKLNQ